jgi:predicted metal-dependent phosphoesterase TrpH
LTDERWADYHIHSCHSQDCRVPVSALVDVAIRRGLREIAVTDHNTIAGGVEAKHYSYGKPISVIVGAEIDTDEGEVIGLNLKEEIVERRLMEVLRIIKDQGGQVMVPHPYGVLRRRRLRVPIDSLKGMVDIIEIHNGRSLFGGRDHYARAVASRLGLRTVLGSDAHFKFEIGNASQSRFNWRGAVGYLFTAIVKRLPRKN